jgi:predicted DNA binding CopG/RHH family protein
MKKLKKIPAFKNEDKERAFWDSHSSVDYIDWSKAKKGIFFNVKPTTRTISIRMPAITLAQLKLRANRMDVPYQSLIKQYVETALEK